MHNSHSLLPIVPLMLGQIPAVDAGALGQWLFCAACAAVLLNYGFTLFRNLTGGFQRKPAPYAEGSPTMADCASRHAAIEAKFAALQTEWKQDRKDLHIRINEISTGITYIKGKLDK